MECIYGYASSVSHDLVGGAVAELRYPCCFNNLVEDLQNEEDRLMEIRNCVQEQVDHAKRQTKKTAGIIHKWLRQANTLTNNVEGLLEEARKKKSWCFGKSPNWIWRYRLGKQIAKNKGEVKKCAEEGSKYTQFEGLASLPGLGYFSSERCLRFESRQSADEKLMKALKSDEVNMIGLYGMGGCGKTTLAIEIGRKAKEEDLFHEVIFVAVPDAVEVQMIQGKIASCLEFGLDEKEEMQRAQRLFRRLAQEEKVLVIMDDVWERLDFEAIGIPSFKNHKGCKVLITTRSEEVCIQNDCQEKIQLSVVTPEEAWEVFKIKAHISEGTSRKLKHLARQISDECEGLLVALTAVASTLKGKGEDDWKVALDRLKNFKPVNIEKGLQNPYNCLRLSYDNLQSTEEQSLFLLCSVFPEDFEIPVENLIRFAIGLGLVGEVGSFERARNEVSAAKNKLIRSCLLSGDPGGKCVKMHDLVRGVALWIASNENKVIKCEQDVTVECSNSVRYLWCKEFPNELDCSNIEFLCIKTELEVPDEIFQGMGRLRVLLLCWEGPCRRPLSTMSFKSLVNLRCLFLSGWILVAISFVEDMKKLESLTLHNCSFLESIDVLVTQPPNLRLLDLSECDLEKNPFEVIGRHPQVEELYIDDCRQEWDSYNECTAEFFSNFRVPQELKRYQIRLGTLFLSGHQEKLCSNGRTLFLSCFDTSNAAVKNLAKRTEVLYIANIHGGAKNVIPDIFQIEVGGGGMDYGWIELLICDSNDVERLVDTGNQLNEFGTLLPELRKLTIKRMKLLGSLYHGRDQSGLFEKLEELSIERCPELLGTLFDWKLNLCSLKALELFECPKLTCIFTYAAAQSVIHLEKLELLYCDELKHVLAEDGSREDSDDDHRRLVFPKLKQLTVRGCQKIEYIIPVTLAQGLLKLQCLEIEFDLELKCIFGPCKLGAKQNQKELKIELPLLEKLTLVNLPNIISICPTNCYAIWPSLHQFTLRNCPEFSIVSINTCSDGRQCDHNTIKMKNNGCLDIIEIRVMKDPELAGIFQVAERSIEGEEDPLTKCIQKLSFICNALMPSMNLQNLDQMEVSGSRESITGGLPQLKKEFMTGNGNTILFTDENGERQHFLNLNLKFKDQLKGFPESTSIPLAPLLNYNSGPFNPCNLKTLVLRSCSMLRMLFSPSAAIRLISLEELLIAECHGLRYIVSCESESAHENKEEIIPEDHESKQYGGSLMFPRLSRISILNCNSLEYILHASFAQDLVKLEDIEIRCTSQLRYVFGENIQDHVQYSSSEQRDKIQIELPSLEKIALFSIPKMISICPDNYYVTCSSSLQRIVMNDVELSTMSISNLMVSHSSALDKRATTSNAENGQTIRSVSIWNSSKIKDIFHLDEFPVNGLQMTAWLRHLNLVNLPELRYIWKGAKHLVTLQNLSSLYIWGCQKLKAIFSPCVLRSLPQLKILVVLQCDELEQIIEEDEKSETVSNPHQQSTKVSFPKLKLLLVTHCNNLKRMFFLSTSHEFPELEYLIINQNPHLEEVFEECKQVVVRERRVEVLLPELKHVVLMQLPNLNNISQGVEFKELTNLLVHNCPKLSLTSTATVEDMLRSYCHDRVIDFFVRCDLLYIRDVINKEDDEKDHMLETTFSQLQMNPQHQPAYCSSDKVLPSQVTGSVQPMPSNLVGSVPKLDQTESGGTESQKVLTLLDMKNKGSQELQSSLGQKLSKVPSANLTQNIEVTEKMTSGEVAEPMKLMLPTFGSELLTPIHKIPWGGDLGESSSGSKGDEGHFHPGLQYHALSKAQHASLVFVPDASITEELNSLVEGGELPAECVATLSSFLTTQPSMRLAARVVDNDDDHDDDDDNNNNASLILKGCAYKSLHRLVAFLAIHPLSSLLLHNKRSEFLDLVHLVAIFPFNKRWLRDLECRVTTCLTSFSISSLEQLHEDKQQVLSALEPLQARFDALHSEIAHLSTRIEPLLLSLSDLEARENKFVTALNTPLLQLQ